MLKHVTAIKGKSENDVWKLLITAFCRFDTSLCYTVYLTRSAHSSCHFPPSVSRLLTSALALLLLSVFKSSHLLLPHLFCLLYFYQDDFNARYFEVKWNYILFCLSCFHFHIAGSFFLLPQFRFMFLAVPEVLFCF